MIKRAVTLLPRFIGSYFCRGRFEVRAVPRLSMEVTNVCDARCVFCANQLMKRPRQHLDMGIFKKAVDEFMAMDGLHIDFNTTIGEPLLDPHLLERARYIKSCSRIKSLGFVTNLQRLDRFNFDEFLGCGITWLCISVSLSGRAKYLEFFGVDRYEQTLVNLEALIKANNKLKNKLALKFSIKPTDEPASAILEHPDFKRINSLLDIDLVPMIKSRNFYIDDWIGKVKLPKYLKRRPLYPRLFRPCAFLYAGLVLFSNGSIGACPCRDFEADSSLILGDIRRDGLKELWSSEKLARLRRQWRRKNIIPDICRACAHYAY